ncbi:MAG: hypothetical protein AVDCRST_MAG56-2553 [uncultured Cytophagales bacterium]|uniref:Uncharacterized protein n=1 Tax=uncultured Cytophagales bacterium TaxID=158755 RepID=A0A6J4IQW3_9SPHI|nr:MAG: hypothetical protein AVDCRST_MAG56-2553 [uncultured Cytophagales bacterium]
MPIRASGFTALGELINRHGFALPFVIEKSGIDRNRLAYLRTKANAVLSLWEAYALAPIFRMTLDQFAEELKRIEEEGGKQ